MLQVFVISHCRSGPVLESAPRRAITALKLRQGSGVVDQVSQDKDRAWDLFDECSSGQRALRIPAADDVPGSDEDS